MASDIATHIKGWPKKSSWHYSIRRVTTLTPTLHYHLQGIWDAALAIKAQDRAIPSMRSLHPLGHLPAFQKDPLQVLTRAMNEYGDVVRFRLAYQNMYLLNRPDLIAQVLFDKDGAFLRGGLAEMAMVREVLGDGMLTTDGQEWAKHRQDAKPWFHHQELARFDEVVQRHGEALCERFRKFAKKGISINLLVEMMRLTVAITGEQFLGYSLTEKEKDEFFDAFTIVQKDFFRRVVSVVAFPSRKVAGASRILESIVKNAVNASGQTSGTYLSSLTQNKRDQAITMLIAATENPSNALTWAFYLLSRKPQFLPKIADRGYLDLFVKELLRLYPGAWVFERFAQKETTIGEFALPKGSHILLCPYTMHRNPRYWKNPSLFWPERFLPENNEGRPQFAYYPFGGGKRACIGANFATLEIKQILTMLINEFDINVHHSVTDEMEPLFTLRPRHLVVATIKEKRHEKMPIVDPASHARHEFSASRETTV